MKTALRREQRLFVLCFWRIRLFHDENGGFFDFHTVVQLFETDADLDLLIAVRTVEQRPEMPADEPPFRDPTRALPAGLAGIGQHAFVHERIVDVSDDVGFERKTTVKIAVAGTDERGERLAVVDLAEDLRRDQTVVERAVMRIRVLVDAEDLRRGAQSRCERPAAGLRNWTGRGRSRCR